MTFLPEEVIGARAAELWRSHRLEPGFDVEVLLDSLSIELLWESIPDDGNDRILGQLDPGKRTVVLNERYLNALEAEGRRMLRYTVGHEIGHWILHSEAAQSGTLSLLEDGRIWCRSGSASSVERQAEMFSARLLMPRDRLKLEKPTYPWSGWPVVYRLAEKFAVSPTSMIIRLEELGWGHRTRLGEPTSGLPQADGQFQLFIA